MRGTPTHPCDLAQHDCLYLGETTDDNRWRFRRGTETQTVEVSGRYIANHAGARLEAAQQDFGIANLPEFTATGALESGELVQVLADWDLEARLCRLSVAALSAESISAAQGAGLDRLSGRAHTRAQVTLPERSCLRA